MKMYVNTDNKGSLNLRLEPSSNGKILARIPYGAEVEVEVFNSDWSKMSYKGISGYVMSKYLEEKKQQATLEAIRDELKIALQLIEEALK